MNISDLDSVMWPEWEIVEAIGSGAYGTVYKIKREDFSGVYWAAMKVLTFPKSESAIETLRENNMSDSDISLYYYQLANDVVKELSVMEKLKGDSNIVSYEDHRIVPKPCGFGWIILIRMELLTPLALYFVDRSFNENDVIDLGIDICSALETCKKDGIIHRDIKTSNIFVSNHGNYKLGDFGLATLKSSQNSDTSPIGTYTFMAPEVYRGEQYNLTIDIYALGLILYRLLNNGRAPFLPPPPECLTEQMVEESNSRRLSGEVFPKPRNGSELMTTIIQKACAFDPNQRFQSPEEMKRILQKARAIENTVRMNTCVPEILKHYLPGIMGDEGTEGETIIVNENERGAAVEESGSMNGFFIPAGDLS